MIDVYNVFVLYNVLAEYSYVFISLTATSHVPLSSRPRKLKDACDACTNNSSIHR